MLTQVRLAEWHDAAQLTNLIDYWNCLKVFNEAIQHDEFWLIESDTVLGAARIQQQVTLLEQKPGVIVSNLFIKKGSSDEVIASLSAKLGSDFQQYGGGLCRMRVNPKIAYHLPPPWELKTFYISRKPRKSLPVKIDNAIGLKIRQGNIGDFATSLHLIQEALLNSLTACERECYTMNTINEAATVQMQHTLTDQRFIYLVGEIDRAVIGHSIIELEPDNTATLLDTHTVQSVRGQGIATQLNKAAEETVAKNNYHKLKATVGGGIERITMIAPALQVDGWSLTDVEFCCQGNTLSH